MKSLMIDTLYIFSQKRKRHVEYHFLKGLILFQPDRRMAPIGESL